MTSVFHTSVLLLIINIVITLKVMTKFIVYNRTDTLKTEVNLFFYDNKLSNCPLSLVAASYKL